MAIRCFSPCIIIQPGPIKKSVSRVFMLHHSQVPANKPPTLQIRSFKDNKVFEDQSRGIACYIDESGEIICEGYDEGPRFHQRVPKIAYCMRDLWIIALLQQSRFDGSHQNDKSVFVQEDFDWNEFNRF